MTGPTPDRPRASSEVFRPLWVKELSSGDLVLHVGEVALEFIGGIPGEAPGPGYRYRKKLDDRSSYLLLCFHRILGSARPGGESAAERRLLPGQDEPARFFEPESLELLGTRGRPDAEAFGLEVLYRLLAELSSPSNQQDSNWERLFTFRCRVARARFYGWLAQYDRAVPSEAGRFLRLCSEALADWRRIVTAQDADAARFLLTWGLDPEQEVDAMLFDPASKGLRPIFLDSETQRHRGWLIKLVEDWYLPRFELGGARRLLLAVAGQRAFPSGEQPGQWARRAGVLWAGWLMVLVAHIVGWWLPEGQGASILVSTGVFVSVAALYIAIRSFISDLPFAFPHLPRLSAGVFLGLLLILSLPRELMQKLLSAGRPPALLAIGIVSVLALLVTLFYLYAELSRRLGPSKRVSRWDRVQRSLLVLTIGWAQASFAATWVSALMAGPILGMIPERAIFLAECGGYELAVSPTFATFASAVALFGGVIVQMVWEQAATTEPPV